MTSVSVFLGGLSQHSKRQQIMAGPGGSGHAHCDSEQPATPTTPRAVHSSLYSQSGESSEEYAQEPPALAASAVPLLIQQRLGAVHAAARQQLDERCPSAAHLVVVLVACACWIAASSATILINKHILVDLSFHFPAAVAALGMLGTTVTSFLVCAVFRLVPCKATVTPYFYFTRIFTTGFFMALSFQAGNTAYLYLTVAFVQMLKAFTPVSTMICGFLFRLEKPTARLIAAVCCICVGVMVSSYGEVNFSWFGVLAMLTSVAAEGLRLVMMQHLLAAKQFHPLEAWMYLAPACTVWLLLLIGVFEVQHIQDQHGFGIMVQHPWYFAFAALAGFSVNAMAMLVIKLASALTLKVLGVCKDIGLVITGVLLLGEHVTGLQAAGYSFSLVGFGFYNYIKASGGGPAPPEAASGQQDGLFKDAKQQAQGSAKAGAAAKAQRSISNRVKQGLIGLAPSRPGGLGDPLLPRAMPPADAKHHGEHTS